MTIDTSRWVEYLVDTEGRTQQQQQQQQKHVHRPPWSGTLDSAYCELEGIFFSFTISEVYSIRSLR